jgi:peptidoglycan/LPS O-acetylase OafA/YrhL
MSWLGTQFELRRTGAAAKLPPMEGLRGFAVLLVFMVHYATAVRPWLAPDTPVAAAAAALHTIGNSGVDLFFVLSGYLIYGSLIGRAQAFGPFMLRRLRRIYPAFGAVFLLYLALSFALPGENKIPANAGDGARYLAENFLLLNGFSHAAPMIAVAWSLSYEMLYYLMLPWLIAVFGLRRRGAIFRVAFFLAMTGIAAAAFAVYGGPVRLLTFGAGILLYEALGAGRLRAPGGALTVATLLAGLASSLLPGSRLARVFSWPLLRRLGNMSFSFYLMGTSKNHSEQARYRVE